MEGGLETLAAALAFGGADSLTLGVELFAFEPPAPLLLPPPPPPRPPPPPPPRWISASGIRLSSPTGVEEASSSPTPPLGVHPRSPPQLIIVAARKRVPIPQAATFNGLPLT